MDSRQLKLTAQGSSKTQPPISLNMLKELQGVLKAEPHTAVILLTQPVPVARDGAKIRAEISLVAQH
jgi:hypothetical protein